MDTTTDVIHKLDFNFIVDGIYIGTNMCCQTHFHEFLIREGVEADISLEEERIDSPFGAHFFIWLPTLDHTPPSPDQLEFGVHTLEKLLRQQKKVYVHCKNGHGRAPTLVAAYLITQGMSAEQAVELIKKQRPVIHLHDSQLLALQTFQTQLSKSTLKS